MTMHRSALEHGSDRYEAGDFDTAADFLQLALNSDRENVAARVKLVTCLRYTDRESEATELAIEGLSFHPGDFEIVTLVAQIYEKQHRIAEAVDLLDRAARIKPTSIATATHRADLLVGLGLMDEARLALLESVTHNGPRPELISSLCDTWIIEHNYGQARNVLTLCRDQDLEDGKRVHSGVRGRGPLSWVFALV